MKAIENRRNPRIDALSLVSYTLMDDNGRALGRGMGRTLNISDGGILLETHSPVNPFDILGLDIGLRDNLVNMMGRVIYRKSGASIHEIGIRFLEAGERQHRMLSSFVSMYHAQKTH